MADFAVVESERLSTQAVDGTGKKISGNLHFESSTNYRRPTYTRHIIFPKSQLFGRFYEEEIAILEKTRYNFFHENQVAFSAYPCLKRVATGCSPAGTQTQSIEYGCVMKIIMKRFCLVQS